VVDEILAAHVARGIDWTAAVVTRVGIPPRATGCTPETSATSRGCRSTHRAAVTIAVAITHPLVGICAFEQGTAPVNPTTGETQKNDRRRSDAKRGEAEFHDAIVSQRSCQAIPRRICRVCDSGCRARPILSG